MNGGRLVDAIEPLDAILTNSAADCSVRVQAAVRLLVIADQELDPELAERAHSWLHVLPQHRSETESCFLRAALVFHTSFGDVNTALSLAKRLEASFPQPSVVEESIRARNFAAFAFYRLRALDDAVSLCDASYDFMKSRGVLNHALYSASLRTEIALTSGNFALASEWLAKAEQAAGGIEPHQLSPNSGLYSNAGILAMMEGRFEDAERFVFAPEKDYSILAAARYRAVSCAISVRLRQRRATNDITDPEIAALELLYLKGRNLGGQDIVVEALWCALVLRGATKEASRMLSEYLKLHRREPGEPDWSLMHATAADDAWLVT